MLSCSKLKDYAIKSILRQRDLKNSYESNKSKKNVKC